MKKKLRTAPFSIDPAAIAEGLLEMFDDNERVALRFGMLPAEKMRVVEDALRNKFLENSRGKIEGDSFTYICEATHEVGDFSMKKLVNEATHEIVLAMYAIGELVV